MPTFFKPAFSRSARVSASTSPSTSLNVRSFRHFASAQHATPSQYTLQLSPLQYSSSNPAASHTIRGNVHVVLVALPLQHDGQRQPIKFIHITPNYQLKRHGFLRLGRQFQAAYISCVSTRIGNSSSLRSMRRTFATRWPRGSPATKACCCGGGKGRQWAIVTLTEGVGARALAHRYSPWRSTRPCRQETASRPAAPTPRAPPWPLHSLHHLLRFWSGFSDTRE